MKKRAAQRVKQQGITDLTKYSKLTSAYAICSVCGFLYKNAKLKQPHRQKADDFVVNKNEAEKNHFFILSLNI